MDKIPEVVQNQPLETLKGCKGYYACPQCPDGRLLGPLVGYAGQYDAPDGTKKHFVGRVYYNFAMAEQWPHLLTFFANGVRVAMRSRMSDDSYTSLFVGAPMGGIRLAGELGRVYGKRAIFAEKKVTAAATGNQREKSMLVWGRHSPEAGDHVVLVEDLVNNYSTTAELVALVEQAGAEVIAVACAINRSPEDHYHAPDGREIPVASYLHIPTEQFKQEDPAVAEYIAAGQICWKPKLEWVKLEAAMANAKAD